MVAPGTTLSQALDRSGGFSPGHQPLSLTASQPHSVEELLDPDRPDSGDRERGRQRECDLKDIVIVQVLDTARASENKFRR